MQKKPCASHLGIPLLALLGTCPAFSQQVVNGAGATAAGQSAGRATPSVRLQEVVVTATKRKENIQKVPAAVIAVSGEALSSAGVTNALGLAKEVPSLVISTLGGVNSLVFLRGVGQTVGANNTADGVAVNLDNVPLPREIGVPEIYDMDRVEVLPGPQGTLYGGSAAGGVINFVTARPTNRFAADGTFETGNYGLAHLTGDVNLPLTNTLAVRGAVNYNRHDGYLSDGLNAEDTVNGRISALWRPTDDLSVLGLVELDNRNGVGPGEVLKGPGVVSPYQSPSDPWSDTYPTKGLFLDNRTRIALLQIDYHFAGDLNLTYIPSAVSSSNSTAQQFQFLYGTPFQTVTASFPETVHEYNQELRLYNDAGGRNRWLAGLYWSKSTHEFSLLYPPTKSLITSSLSNDVSNYAVYGQDTYSLLDSWRITAGGRVSQDKFDGGGSVNALGSGYSYGGSQTHNMVDWKLGTEVDLSASSMAYLTVQTGYVMGGYAQVPSTSNNPKILAPEKLLSYTIGVKNRFLSDTLQINDEAFYYDYKDYQLQLLEGLTNAAVGVPRSVIYGDELDIRYRFTPHEELGLSPVYMSAQIKTPPSVSPQLRGYALPDSPHLTVSAWLEHDIDLPNDGTVAARVQTYFNSGYWTIYTHELYSDQTKFTRTDLTLTYYPADSRWSAGLFARNIENAAVYSGCSAATKPGDPLGCSIEAPRTFGVRFQMHLR